MAAIFWVKMAKIWKTNPLNGFLTIRSVKFDTFIVLFEWNRLKIADFGISKMDAGGHFEFWPFLGLAHTFARDMGAHFVSKYLKVSESTLKPSSALGGHGRFIYDPTVIADKCSTMWWFLFGVNPY